MEILNAKELVDRNPKMREPIIDGLLRRGEICNLVSAPKMRKSWTVLDLAISVANGEKWLDQFKTTQSDVLLIDMECHSETLAYRIDKIAASYGSANLERIHVYAARDSGGLAGIQDLKEKLEEKYPQLQENHIAASFGPIILDPGYQLLDSGKDENSNMHIRDFYCELGGLGRYFNCGTMLVHHSSKGNQAFKEITDCGSGAGSQARACDSHMVMKKHQQKDCCVIQGVLRSFEEFEPFCLRWEFPRWRKDDTVNPSQLARKASVPGHTDQEIDNRVLQALLKKEDTRSGLSKRLPMKDDKVKASINRLLKDQKIRQCSVKKGNREWGGYCVVA